MNRYSLHANLFIYDLKYWREWAAEVRALANAEKNTDGRQLMLMLVKNFDWLADWASLQTKKSANCWPVIKTRRVVKTGR